jgi:hypothetical protein
MKTRYGIEADEWYPVYELSDDAEPERWIDLTDAEHADWEATLAAFEAWQRRFKEAREATYMHRGGGG